MIDKHYTHCPLCGADIVIEENSIYPARYPTYHCSVVVKTIDSYYKSHYVKYFSGDYGSSYYAESVRVGDYNIYNHYVFHDEKNQIPNRKDWAVVYETTSKKRVITNNIVKLDKPEIMIKDLEKLFE